MRIYRDGAGTLTDATPHQLPEAKSRQALIKDFVRSIQEHTPVPGEHDMPGGNPPCHPDICARGRKYLSKPP